MNPERYLNERVQGQIDWFEAESEHNRTCFHLYRIVQIASIALLTMLVGFTGSSVYMKFFVGILGAAAIISTSALSLFRFQELWSEYRAKYEELTKEQYLFLAQVHPYDRDDAFPLFVTTVESLLVEQNQSWHRREPKLRSNQAPVLQQQPNMAKKEAQKKAAGSAKVTLAPHEAPKPATLAIPTSEVATAVDELIPVP